MQSIDVKDVLDFYANKYNNSSFIEEDPISIPHGYTRKQDIEISAFWTAILSWGNRKTIINKANLLFSMMGNSPYDFVMSCKDKDLIPLNGFVHRTFQPADALYFVAFFKHHYQNHDSLESAFLKDGKYVSLEESLNVFKRNFFELQTWLPRTKKHISAPQTGSTCKRINMFLRWMVRKDNNGVDFGIWNEIPQSDLKIPFDVHVERIARKCNLLKRKNKDWKAVLELTDALCELDPKDPVKYDFALFGMGILEKKEGSLELLGM